MEKGINHVDLHDSFWNDNNDFGIFDELPVYNIYCHFSFNLHAWKCVSLKTQAHLKIFSISLHSKVQVWWTLSWEFASREFVRAIEDHNVTTWPLGTEM